MMRALSELRESLFRNRLIPERFHAAEDRQATRDEVFETIREIGGFTAHIFVTEKTRVPTSHREEATFYNFMADLALRMVLQRYASAEPIYLVTDAIPVKGKREAVTKGFKSSVAAIAKGRSYEIAHHASASQFCLQAADYVNWAVFRKWERGDLRSYELIQGFLVDEITPDWTLIK